jgi:hypothetical protein
MGKHHLHHDTPPAGMGGTYDEWLRFQGKEARRRLREEKQEQALRTARYHERAAKAARTRRKHARRNELWQALNGLLVAAVAAGSLIGSAALKAARRTGL